MRRVPLLLLATDDPTRAELTSLVESLGGDLTGREGFSLEIASDVGPEPSIVVDATSDDRPETVDARRRAGLDAIAAGHAFVTADLRIFTADPVDLAVALADRRVGIGAAVAPGTGVVHALTRLQTGGDVVEELVLSGASAEQLADEATVLSGLIGIELGPSHVRGADADALTEGALTGWVAKITRDAFPSVTRTDDRAMTGRRRVHVRTSRLPNPLILEGPGPDAAAIASALFADVVELARAPDTPWRAHRRKVAALS